MKIIEKYQPIAYPLNDITPDLRSLIASRLLLTKQLTNEQLPTLLLILMLFVPILSEEELCYFFSGDSAYANFHRAFDLNRQSGLVEGVALYPQVKNRKTQSDTADSRTMRAYLITRKGFYAVCEYVGLSHEDYHPIKTSRYNIHTYSNGFNFFAFLTNPFTKKLLSYETEVNQAFGKKFLTNDRGLCIDDIAKLSGATLYLEQDMGTENIPKLREKMHKYGLHSDYLITSSTESVVLSFRKGYQCIAPVGRAKGNKRYSLSALRHTIEAFEHPMSFDAMEMILEDMDSHKLETLIKGLDRDIIVTDHAQSIYDLYSDIKKHDLLNNLDTYEKLKEHYTQYELLRSPCYFAEFNNIQYRFMLNRRNGLIKDMIDSSDGFKLIGKDYGRTNHDVTSYVLKSLHVYTVPTIMLSYYLPFILYQSSFVKEVIENTLASYPMFKGFDKKSYKPKFYIDNKSPYRIPDSRIRYGFTMSNYYESDGFILFIENLSLDLGAVARVSAAKQSFSQEYVRGRKNVAIIALVDSIEDAEYFRDLLNLSEIKTGNCPFQVFFLECKNPYINTDGKWSHINSYTELSDKTFFRYLPGSPTSRWYIPLP